MHAACIIEQLLFLIMYGADVMAGSCRAGVVDAVWCMTHGAFVRIQGCRASFE